MLIVRHIVIFMLVFGASQFFVSTSTPVTLASSMLPDGSGGGVEGGRDDSCGNGEGEKDSAADDRLGADTSCGAVACKRDFATI